MIVHHSYLYPTWLSSTDNLPYKYIYSPILSEITPYTLPKPKILKHQRPILKILRGRSEQELHETKHDQFPAVTGSLPYFRSQNLKQRLMLLVLISCSVLVRSY